MEQAKARDLARRLMASFGLAADGWTFRFDRAKTSGGKCNYRDRVISLSVYFVRMNDEPLVEDTIRHEIAHALAGPRAGHGPRWRTLARQVGANPRRLMTDAKMPQGKWRAICRQCGCEFRRHRRPRRGVYRHRSPTCDGTLTPWENTQAGSLG